MTEAPTPKRGQACETCAADIGRRHFLRLAALAVGGAAAAALGGGEAAAQAKRSKEAANYQTSPNGGQRCAECQFFNAGSQTCQIVEGQISPNGWCQFFRRAGALGGY